MSNYFLNNSLHDSVASIVFPLPIKCQGLPTKRAIRTGLANCALLSIVFRKIEFFSLSIQPPGLPAFFSRESPSYLQQLGVTFFDPLPLLKFLVWICVGQKFLWCTVWFVCSLCVVIKFIPPNVPSVFDHEAL